MQMPLDPKLSGSPSIQGLHPLYGPPAAEGLPESSPDPSPESSLPEPYTPPYASHTDSVQREEGKHI